MSRGYNAVFRAEGGQRVYDARRRNRVELLRWNEEPVDRVNVVSAFSGDSLSFLPSEIDELIGLLQQAKAALAGPIGPGATASSPAVVAPVAPQEKEGPSAAATAEGPVEPTRKEVPWEA